MNTIKKLALLGSILSIGAAYGMDSQTVDVEVEEVGCSPLLVAPCSEGIETVKLNYVAEIERIERKNAIVRAMRSHDAELIEDFYRIQADTGKTPLQMAAEPGYPKVFKLLLARVCGAVEDPSEGCRNVIERGANEEAIRDTGSQEVCERIIELGAKEYHSESRN